MIFWNQDKLKSFIDDYKINAMENMIINISSELNDLKRNVLRLNQDYGGSIKTLFENEQVLEYKIKNVSGDREKIENEDIEQIVEEFFQRNIRDKFVEFKRNEESKYKEVDELKTIVSQLTNYYSEEAEREIYNYCNDVNQKVENQNREIYELKSMIMQLINNNTILTNKIKQQAEHIKKIENELEKQKITVVKENINFGEPLKEEKKETKRIFTTNIPEIENYKKQEVVAFSDNEIENLKIVENFQMQTKLLKTQMEEKFSDESEIDICIRLVDKCIDKLDKLQSKNEKSKLEPDCLANECAKILRQTIIKILSKKKLAKTLDNYFENCHVRKVRWFVGKKLEDEDYDYLDEPVLYEEVEDETKKNTICKIIQDGYIIDYIEDDIPYEVVIPGIYCVGSYKKS